MERRNEIVARGKRVDEERQSRLWFFESMDQITRALEDTEHPAQISHAFDKVLSVFGCDRAWMAHPCDPESPTWRTVFERASPEFSDSSHLHIELPMDAEVAHMHRIVRASDAAVQFGSGAEHPIPSGIAERFGVWSRMCLAVYPKTDDSYIFGLDHCTCARNWTDAEQSLFEATGQRLARLLTTLSMSRELQESKARLEEAQRVAHMGHFQWDLIADRMMFSDELYRIYGLRPQQEPIDMELIRELIHPEDRERVFCTAEKSIRDGVRIEMEHRIVRRDGDVRTIRGIGSVKQDASGRAHEYFGTVHDITERKRAEEERQTLSRELEDSKARLEEAQRLAHIGHFQLDLISNRMTLSDELCRIYGLDPQDQPFDMALIWGMLHPEDRERVFQSTQEHIRNGVQAEENHRIIRADGEVRTLLGFGTVKKDSSGRAYEYFGTGQDVTERKRAEEERQALSRDLEESKARLEEAQRVAHMGHFQWDLIENRLTWSDELYRIYGLPPQNGPVDIAVVRELQHPDDREAVFQLAEKVIVDGGHAELEHHIVRPDGEVRVVQSIGDVKRDTAGRAYEFFGTVQDITERKRAEEERQSLSRDLEESKAWLEEAQRVTHVGYWVWDLETNRVVCSDETYRIFGLEPKVGPIDLAMLSEMFHFEDRERVFRTADEAIRSGTRADCEHRLVRPNGEVRVVHSLGDLTKDAAGRPCQMFGTTQDITERKRAEEERQALSRNLLENRAWLEEAQRVAHVGYWVWDLDTNRVTWSDETYRIFGLTPQEHPIDMAVVLERIHPEDRERVSRIADAAIRSGKRADCEHRILRPNGEVRVIHALGDLKKDASGRPYQMFGTKQDITERKCAEEALQRSQFYLSEGARLGHMGSWSWASSDLGIGWSADLDIYWSDEVYDIFGLDPKNGSPSFQQFLSFIHPDDRDSMTHNIISMYEQRCSCDLTSRIIRQDGEVRYVRCVGVPDLEREVFKGFHGTTMDVTEHELLTQELRRERAYLAEAQRLTHAGSWAVNLVKRQVFHSSDENNRLYGFDVSEYPNPFDLHYSSILPEDEPSLTANLEEAVSAGADFDVEYRIRRADGAIRVLRGIGHHNPAQGVGEYFGITMDITDRKRAAEERERLRRLEADLAHVNRVNMMGELAAALAHEIKQPIAASITSANALRRWLSHNPPELERARTAAVRIEQEGNRAADIINNLRSFYKTGTSAARQSVDVNDTIKEMTDLLRTEAARHSVTMCAEVEADMPQIMSDRVQLQQVLMNLMLNAIEAMKDAGGNLAIRSRLDSEGQLTVSISDTGVGLPAESAERIFDPFHTTKPQGTGMGLTITRSIVESHGGKIWATCNNGPGATFHFTLPTGAEAHA
jgi:PAS domain S-box-containing protein